MRVIDELIYYLSNTGLLSFEDQKWLVTEGFMDEVYPGINPDDRCEEDEEFLWESSDSKLAELEKKCTRRERQRSSSQPPGSSKGARRKRKIRGLIRGHGIQGRDSRRQRAEKQAVSRTYSQTTATAAPALIRALSDSVV